MARLRCTRSPTNTIGASSPERLTIECMESAMTDVVVHLSSPASRHVRIAHGMRRLLDELPDAVLKDIGLKRYSLCCRKAHVEKAKSGPEARSIRLERSVAERDDPPFARDRFSPRACGSSHRFSCFYPFIRRPSVAVPRRRPMVQLDRHRQTCLTVPMGRAVGARQCPFLPSLQWQVWR